MRPPRLPQLTTRACRLAEPDNSLRRWTGFLDDLEGQLADQRASLSEENLVLGLPQTAWQPPPELGAMPESLATRVQRLLSEIMDLGEQFADRRRETAGQLRAVGAVPRDDVDTPVYLDSVG